ncbi:MAG: low specificity L-threonine aldolase [Alphaproteobacteria bacterium]|jgi:threonine aldolase|nr:low specificity L-threonine aldolase [Alphaproteobacteria bacterium]
MNFSSDNASGCCPEIMAALAEVNAGPAMAYGNDAATTAAVAALAELFECKLEAFPVATGTAANALALSVLTPPWGLVYCHRHAHIEEDECGAPELFSGGAKLHLLDGADAKFDAETLSRALAGAGPGVEHHPQPAAVSITQASELGTVYSADEIAAIAEVAHGHGLGLHMDGARFANAVVSANVSPADLSWRAGVDVMSFGATKNGAMAAEAVLFFKPELAADFRYRRKRGGHLFSKMRFLSAQLRAYATDDLWRRNAQHANAMAARLADGLAALPDAGLAHPVQANEIFIALPEAALTAMAEAGVVFHRWGGAESRTIRLVTAYDTEAAVVDAAIAIARGALAGAEGG